MSLVWIVPAVAIMASSILDDVGIEPPIHDWLFVVVFIGSSLLLGVFFLLWRRFVTWTVRRVAGTGGATALVLTHVLIWQPLWEAGCGAEDVLRLGQSCVMGGLWMVAAAYVWWGIAEAVTYARRVTMPPYAVRLIYGMALIPFIAGLFLIVGIAVDDLAPASFQVPGLARDRLPIFVANLVCGSVIVVWWWAVWRRAVRMTAEQFRPSLALAAGYVLVAVLAVFPKYPGSWEHLAITLPMLLTGLWLVVTTWRWHPRTAESLRGLGDVKEKLTCSACGYSLVGLREARCPECGRQSTLDELFENVLAAHGYE